MSGGIGVAAWIVEIGWPEFAARRLLLTASAISLAAATFLVWRKEHAKNQTSEIEIPDEGVFEGNNGYLRFRVRNPGGRPIRFSVRLVAIEPASGLTALPLPMQIMHASGKEWVDLHSKEYAQVDVFRLLEAAASTIELQGVEYKPELPLQPYKLTFVASTTDGGEARRTFDVMDMEFVRSEQFEELVSLARDRVSKEPNPRRREFYRAYADRLERHAFNYDTQRNILRLADELSSDHVVLLEAFDKTPNPTPATISDPPIAALRRRTYFAEDAVEGLARDLEREGLIENSASLTTTMSGGAGERLSGYVTPLGRAFLRVRS